MPAGVATGSAAKAAGSSGGGVAYSEEAVRHSGGASAAAVGRWRVGASVVASAFGAAAGQVARDDWGLPQPADSGDGTGTPPR